MGTRHLTAVVLNGEYKIAQYGQWDGYPSGQGRTALAFLHSKKRREKLKKQLARCVFVTEEEMTEALAKLGLNEWMTAEEANRFHAEFPFVNRDHGAYILDMVANTTSNPIRLQNSISFAEDSLFCEWAYVVDFDKNTFEVYRGFNKSPIENEKERFAKMAKTKYDHAGEYYPIRLFKKYSLSKLPTEKAFLSTMDKLRKKDD
jgi:hypothetical protein